MSEEVEKEATPEQTAPSEEQSGDGAEQIRNIQEG